MDEVDSDGRRDTSSAPTGVTPLRLGLIGALLMLIGVGVLGVLAIPVFAPVDEVAHYGYAASVAEGHLPTIDTPIPTSGSAVLEKMMSTRDEAHSSIWTANHPPLFYLALAAPVGVGRAIGHELGAVRVGRLMVLFFGALVVLVVAGAVRRLLPNVPEAAVVAAGVTATFPVFVNTSSLLYNDSLAVLGSALIVTLCLVWLVKGPSRMGLVLLTVCCALTALTRATGLMTVGIAMVAVFVGTLLHDRDTMLPDAPTTATKRVWAAIKPPAIIGAVVLVVSGWFYVRNIHLYGDLTGQAALLEKFDRSPRGSATDYLFDLDYWVLQQRRAWNPGTDYPINKHHASRNVWWLMFVPLAGLAVLIVRTIVRRVRAHLGQLAASEPWRARPGLVVAWALGGVYLMMVQWSVASFAAAGGGSHARYLLIALPFLVGLMVLGLVSLPGARRALPAMAFIGLALAANVWVLAIQLKGMTKQNTSYRSLIRGLQASGVPAPAFWIVLTVAVSMAGLAMVLASLWRIRTATALDDQPR